MLGNTNCQQPSTDNNPLNHKALVKSYYFASAIYANPDNLVQLIIDALLDLQADTLKRAYEHEPNLAAILALRVNR